MGLRLQYHPLDVAVHFLGEAVLLLHLVALLLQDAPSGALPLRLECVEHGGAHQQVGEHADDERQRPDVLFLHPRRWRAKSAADGADLQVAACCSSHQPVAPEDTRCTVQDVRREAIDNLLHG